MNNQEIIELAENILRVEAEAVQKLATLLTEDFCKAVRMIADNPGRIIASGLGKSGIIAQKISATFASLGTPSLFLHPVEAVHGDLGRVTETDIILAFSNSGETAEVIALLPFIRRLGGKIIGITGNVNSTLARNSDCVLNAFVEKEACSYNPAPTASTTAALALGDALCIAVSRLKKVDAVEFARYHPGGILGRNLILTVGEIMYTGDQVPVIHKGVSLRQAVIEMTKGKLGMILLSDYDNRLCGILTDGDLRRLLEKDPQPDFLNQPVENFSSAEPSTLSAEALAEEAISRMEAKKITSLVIIDNDKKIQGVIHLHQLISARVV